MKKRDKARFGTVLALVGMLLAPKECHNTYKIGQIERDFKAHHYVVERERSGRRSVSYNKKRKLQ